MDELTGRTAVVTGAASGIGLALAERFGAEGMRLVLADVEQQALQAAERKLRDAGGEVLAVRADVASDAEVRGLADAAIERFGKVHIVCNNAGVVARHDAWGPLADWEWVLGVDLWGVIHGVRAFVPHMLEHGEPSHIVNTASVAGLLAFPGIASYNVAKRGVVALSETLHHELRDSQVGVSVLCPGVVTTRIGESERNRTDGHAQPFRRAGAGGQAAEAIQPERVAADVLDAIRADRFWILTHPRYGKLALDNAQSAVQGTDPVGPTIE